MPPPTRLIGERVPLVHGDHATACRFEHLGYVGLKPRFMSASALLSRRGGADRIDESHATGFDRAEVILSRARGSARHSCPTISAQGRTDHVAMPRYGSLRSMESTGSHRSAVRVGGRVLSNRRVAPAGNGPNCRGFAHRRSGSGPAFVVDCRDVELGRLL